MQMLPERTRPWSLVPASLRRAGVIALTTALLAGALLYQENVRSEKPPDFSRGGAFAQDLADGGSRKITVATPIPRPTAQSRSSATLTAPMGDDDIAQFTEGGSPFQFPALGRYVYDVDGTESASIFGTRDYPPEMTMTVHRPQPGETDDPEPKADELAFDLDFSSDHEEREIVAYRRNGIMFTFEGGTVTFGPRTQTSEAVYEPPITQIPIPLKLGAAAKGTTRALSPDDGSEVRVEDWTAQVLRRERIEIKSERIDTFVVEVKRQTRPGSSEQVTRSRTYWLDPARAIWVKWEEHLKGSQDVGLGSFTYTSDFTATLDRLEAL
jgi:hypothetical protein